MAELQLDEPAIFDAARKIKEPSERQAYLQQACAGDDALRARIQSLLNVLDRESAFLEAPVGGNRPAMSGPTLTDAGPGREGPGTVIGPYKLLEEIGAGGMGAVFRAVQTEPVRREVALKIIKPGMDSREVIARFEAERQALAIMDHTNIARVLDAGTTALGRPYFVMELVKGTPITDFCDNEKLSLRERLELFISVCQAVQHAHQKGIIHRDLKPSNILVGLYDGKPVPKVIDFGVAKAVHQKLTERTLFTALGALVGTPEYMAPEQAVVDNVDIDTRADIYSLGVVLYILLTGSPPFAGKQLRQAAFNEMLRVIREVEPPKPSTKLSTADELPSIAAHRRSEPKRLTKSVQGELDWIVMKCLEKERSRRYETANGLARDIERYLHDEPVEARAPSAAYRFRKFLHRNRASAIAASLVLLALVGGVVGTSWGMWQARLSAQAERIAKQEAVTAAAAEKSANEQTQRRLKQIEKGVELLAGLLKGINPLEEKPGGPTLYQQLRDRAANAIDQLDGELVGDPLMVARLQSILGATLTELGNPHKSIEVLKKSSETQRRLLGVQHRDTLAAMDSLALAYICTGQGQLAMPIYQEVLQLRKANLGDDHPDTLESMNNLAVGYMGARNWRLALPLLEEYLKRIRAIRGKDHPETLLGMHNLASVYQAAGKLDLALQLNEETLKLCHATLGPDHPDTLHSMHNLAANYEALGKLDLAVKHYEETLRARRAKLGFDHPETLKTIHNLGSVYQRVEKLNLALPLLQEAATCVESQNFQPDISPRIVQVLCQCHEMLKQFDQSEPWRRKLVAVVKKRSGAESPAYSGELATFGKNLLEQEKWNDAETVLRESLNIRERHQPEVWTTFSTRSMLGAALSGQKRYADAEPLLLNGYKGLKDRAAAIPPTARAPQEATRRLVQLYEAMDRKDEAAKWQKELDAFKAREKPPAIP